ncbi:hypothetical protein ACH49M_21625 [Rhodococcus qingshengii]|uniref:hypothetical protein n=1 Tax=Rhodococcus qingshengii TaxID=334542 RepID=UPI003700A738
MPARPESITWITDVAGKRIGVGVTASPSSGVRLLVPSVGIDKLLSPAAAKRLIDQLQQGVAFAEITGSTSFRLDLHEI